MYYPDQCIIAKQTTIRREVHLPEEAIGKVQVTIGKAVEIRDVVAHGAVTSEHVLLDGAEFFGLKDSSKLEELMLVSVGSAVKEGQALAGRSADRGKRLLSPITGILTRVENGQIIVQNMPHLIDLQAGVKGEVVDIQPGRGVTIESSGTQVQGVWGNGRSVIANLRLEPEAGLEDILEDQLNLRYKGAIIVTRRPMKVEDINRLESQNLAGLIAPSMDASLREAALKSSIAFMLTEGFGNMRMSSTALNLLTELDGRAVTLDALLPGRWNAQRPSVMLVQPLEEPGSGIVNYMLSLRRGMRVRISRDPYAGQMGKVVDLPKTPLLLENGLRVPGAKIELISGQIVDIPYVNLEFAGR